MEKRDYENIANYSCIPWVDFESITSVILTGNQIQPLITWGKVNKNYEMSVAITVSHIFVNGRELGLFYKKVQENFNQSLEIQYISYNSKKNKGKDFIQNQYQLF